MSSRYQKTDQMLLQQQQKSHYEHLYNPRATIRIESQQRKTHSLYYKTKNNWEKDRQRKLQNKKMLISLLGIYNGQGLLSKVEEQSRTAEEMRSRSFNNYKKQSNQKSIRKENRDLYYSILHAGPSIGTKQDWNKHFEQHLQLEKRLTNYPQNDNINLSKIRLNLTQQKKRQLISVQKQKSLQNSHQNSTDKLIPDSLAILSLKKEKRRKKLRLKKQKLQKQAHRAQQILIEEQ